MTHRLIPVAQGASVTLWSGTNAETTYAASPGQTIDVADNVAAQLLNAGFLQVGSPVGSGSTANRPTFPGAAGAGAGATYIDTTLNAVVLFDGSAWRSPATGAAL